MAVVVSRRAPRRLVWDCFLGGYGMLLPYLGSHPLYKIVGPVYMLVCSVGERVRRRNRFKEGKRDILPRGVLPSPSDVKRKKRDWKNEGLTVVVSRWWLFSWTGVGWLSYLVYMLC